MKLTEHISGLRRAEYKDQYIRKLEWDGEIESSEAATLRIYLKSIQKLAAEEARHEEA